MGNLKWPKCRINFPWTQTWKILTAIVFISWWLILTHAAHQQLKCKAYQHSDLDSNLLFCDLLDSLKDEMDLNEEDEIFTEMMKVVEERDELVSALEEQRVKEKAEDRHFESIILSRGCQLSGI